MSPRGFTAYALLWTASSAAILLLAVRIALAPWLPSGVAPEYTLSLLGAREAAQPPGCRVILRDAQGNEIQSVVAGSCADAQASASKPPPPRHAPGEGATAIQRWVASALHSALALGVGALLAWLLRVGLHRAFSRHGTTTTWVLRARG